MAGYSGYSMSNNAVDAYASGEKPKSKWTKQDFIDYAEENYPATVQIIKKMTIVDLKTWALTETSWHHTSKFYNETKFYSMDENFFERINECGYNCFPKKEKEKTPLLTYYVFYPNTENKRLVQEFEDGTVKLFYKDFCTKTGKLSDLEKDFIYLPGIENSSAGIAAKRGQAKLALFEKQLKKREDQKTKARKPGQGLEKRETQNTKGMTL